MTKNIHKKCSGWAQAIEYIDTLSIHFEDIVEILKISMISTISMNRTVITNRSQAQHFETSSLALLTICRV